MKSTSGFTLIEVLLAVILSTIMMAGLYGIFFTTFTSQKNSYGKEIAQSGTVLSAKAILRDVESSGFVMVPGPGGTSNSLSGCTNFDRNLGGEIDPGLPVRNYLYCFDGSRIFRYIKNPAACPACCQDPAPACPPNGAPIGGWQTPMELATGVSPQLGGVMPVCSDADCLPGCTSSIFCRSHNNVVSLHYLVTGATPTITVDTSISFLTSESAP